MEQLKHDNNPDYFNIDLLIDSTLAGLFIVIVTLSAIAI